MDDPWHDLSPALALPPRVRPWAFLDTSMTEAVARAAGEPVRVEVLRQGRGRLLGDERRLLAPGPATVREVRLLAGGVPLLVARTAFTSRRLAAHPVILGLGDRPLGSLFFAGPRPAPRTAHEAAHLGPGAALRPLLRRTGVRGAVWARRTVFWLFGEPLLVTEALLPDLLRLPQRSGSSR